MLGALIQEVLALDPASPVYVKHLERLKTTLLRRYSAATIARWIVENTFHSQTNYSYKDHEYQEKILSDTSVEVVVKKCSQVGISEASARMALALVCVMNPYTVAYTLPTASFAGVFAKTRIDPIIEGSEILRESVHRTNNNNEVKQFGESFLFLRGAQSSNSPISIPVDHLIHDEWDFSDMEVLGQYVSRLTHSRWKRKTKISTPTHMGYGIDVEFKGSRQHYLFVKCNHCNHQFIPDYYKDVRIPGMPGFDLHEFTKRHQSNSKWRDAQLHCPRCSKVPSLQKEYREWVCKNPSENFVAAGYQVSPFDAPNIITVSDLLNASVGYARRQDFDNFNLGLAVEDKEATFVAGEFEKWFVQAKTGSGYAYVMGVDVGAQYHFVVHAVDGFGRAVCVHRERVGMRDSRRRYHELRKEWHIGCTVMDSLPHGETVMTLQGQDNTMYASVYVKKKTLTIYEVKDKDDSKDEAKTFVRQVNVNRNRSFDGYMEWVRANNLTILKMNDDEDQAFIDHHCSMKRTKIPTPDGQEFEYVWQKTDGEDHYHHASQYAWIAGQIRGIARSGIVLPLFAAQRVVIEKEMPKAPEPRQVVSRIVRG
jgi:hypothetical protein